MFKFPRQRICRFFIEFSFNVAARNCPIVGDQKSVGLLRSLSPDDQADFFNVLSEKQYDAVLPELALKEREDLIKLAFYPEGSLVSVMNTDYLPPSTPHYKSRTREIRLERTIRGGLRIYVSDSQRRLVGPSYNRPHFNHPKR